MGENLLLRRRALLELRAIFLADIGAGGASGESECDGSGGDGERLHGNLLKQRHYRA